MNMKQICFLLLLPQQNPSIVIEVKEKNLIHVFLFCYYSKYVLQMTTCRCLLQSTIVLFQKSPQIIKLTWTHNDFYVSGNNWAGCLHMFVLENYYWSVRYFFSWKVKAEEIYKTNTNSYSSLFFLFLIPLHLISYVWQWICNPHLYVAMYWVAYILDYIIVKGITNI